jgi:hypothetical protein
MAAVTVLIPTTEHSDLLPLAIASVQDQSFADFELLVVGDGASDDTQDQLSDLIRMDSRIKYFHNKKGLGHGELHRAKALSQCSGSMVFYLGDDDLYLPHHLEVMMGCLIESHFAHTAFLRVTPSGEWEMSPLKLSNALVKSHMLVEKWNFFGPTCAGHTLDAYRRLPFGWQTKPNDTWSDLHMWRQWLEQPWLKVATFPYPTTLTFPTPWRRAMTPDNRRVELKYWFEESRQPQFRSKVEGYAREQLGIFHQSWLQGLSHAVVMVENGGFKQAQELVGMVEFNIGAHVDVHYVRSVIAGARGESEVALKLAMQATEHWPESSEAHFRLARLAAATDEWQLAASAISNAIKLDPDMPQYHDFLHKRTTRD